MKPKVRIRQIVLPLLISYAAGLSLLALIAIDIVFAAPIFYAIYKYIPKQNHLKVEN